METALITVWLAGWVVAVIFTATVIGNVENYPGDKAKSFPAFVIPLCFGWFWPAALALAVIVAPLAWLSDRATKRHEEPDQ